MGWRACAVALWCAVLVTGAAAYTVDCNHEYTDCDTELSKLTNDDEELSSITRKSVPSIETSSSPVITTTAPTTEKPETNTEKRTETTTTSTTEKTEGAEAPELSETPEAKKARLLNLNVDDLQNFANAIHNQTQSDNNKKPMTDLSDVNLDDDDDEPSRMVHDHNKHDKQISDKFYTNLQAPFNPLLTIASEEDITNLCKENGITYKIGERMDRGCEESCECVPGGSFECSARCKHPYIRQGRRLNDPLCFETPVDECCSIIACATGNGENKPTRIDVCRYGNDTYPVGAKWNIGCEQKCSCEVNSIVTCKPRCKTLPPSDQCINVQDPNDACCEIQICDVSQDVHEEPLENVTSSTTTTKTTTVAADEDRMTIPFIDPTEAMRPLVLAEPIGSIKVLQNNSVQVNLIHMNNSEDPIHLLLSNDGGKNFKDVELKYSNLILNLQGGKDYILKTRETGTKFNFTMTAFDEDVEDELNGTGKIGCRQDGKFYGVGEEFHIGCTELCECTGADTRECVELVCPSHVGLELVSKGCVRWAPSPPAQPPNCCPRAARCLSDGTCHYKGVAIPNWSEVPIKLTGCEQRCFCENGELDCQEVCSPLPPVPPQTLRCPRNHRPAAVNVSDDDCCKEWGCVPNAGIAENTIGSTLLTFSTPTLSETPAVYVTPVAPTLPSSDTNPPTLPIPTDPSDFYRHLHPVKSYPKIIKTSVAIPIINDPQKYLLDTLNYHIPEGLQSDNITVFTLDDPVAPTKNIEPEPSLKNNANAVNWKLITPQNNAIVTDNAKKMHVLSLNPYQRKHPKYVFSDSQMHDLINPLVTLPTKEGIPMLYQNSLVKKVPISDTKVLNYFVPAYLTRMPTMQNIEPGPYVEPTKDSQQYFEPTLYNRSSSNVPRKELFHGMPYYPTHPWKHSRGNILTVEKDEQNSKSNDHLWNEDGDKEHVLIKAPNPYETVLLRPVPNTPLNPLNRYKKIQRVGSSALDLERLVNQMEMESEVNRNLERSADKVSKAVAAGQTPTADMPQFPNPQKPSFLPTIPPEIHFPQDEDYENNVNRPHHPLEPILPPVLPIQPNFGDDNKKLTVISLQADSPTSVKLLFGLPPVLVGLRGSVDLRYTDRADEDISHWYSQVFAPADEVLTTPRLEFRLTGLKPSTLYRIRGKLYLHNLPVEPESEVYTVRTLDMHTIMPAPVEEKRREVDSRLTVVDVNDTVAHVSWRHFTDDELQFIDGIQVRYRPVGTPIYSMTELLHHSRSLAELHDLRPGSRYEASLILVPPPRATTELHDPGKVEFTTSPHIDPYNWTVSIDAHVVGSEAAELTWRGVPSPAERWVRVYRAAHACGASRREHDAFRLAARDLPPTVLLTGLQPNSRCRVWLELFLTNGKVKTSNVLEINTKSQDTPADIDNEIEASSVAGSRGSPRGDYYGALVVVGVVAALGALTSLLLLLVLVRRHRPRSVPITPVPSAPRESSLPPYDNPAYKLELQQETMDL